MKRPDALSRLCDNHMLSKESKKPAHKRHQAFLASIEPKHRISDAVFKQIAAVHNSMVDHWGLQKCREFLNDPTTSRLKILIKMHPFTCASYNDKGNSHILVMRGESN
jgi:hypothetical protein